MADKPKPKTESTATAAAKPKPAPAKAKREPTAHRQADELRQAEARAERDRLVAELRANR